MPKSGNTPSASAAAIVRRSVREQARELVSKPAKNARKSNSEMRVRWLMTPKQVQEALQVSESWLKRSDIPYFKLDRLKRYDADEIEEYLDARLSTVRG
jgi:hypothetical protein